MKSLNLYYACNSKTKNVLFDPDYYDDKEKERVAKGRLPDAVKADDGILLYKNRRLIVDDAITAPGIHEVVARLPGDLAFSEYSEKAVETAIYPGQGTFIGLIYAALKSSGEAGEFAENVGKALRDDEIIKIDGNSDNTKETWMTVFELSEERRDKLILELGDELWYWFAKCRELGVMPSYVAAVNIEKLSRRAAEGKLSGSGSER